MARAEGQLERSLAALTIGVHQSVEARRHGLADTKAGEFDQQVQLPLNGLVGPAWLHKDVEVHWELPFLFAPSQRRVPFTVPHFSKGFEVIGGALGITGGAPADLVLFDAHVLKWTITDERWYVGATVRLAACAPNSGQNFIVFRAMAHLTFQGYAGSAEQEDITA